MNKDKNFLYKIIDIIRSLFLNGILIILPIALTIVLFNAAFKLIKKWLVPVQQIQPTYLQMIPHAEIIVALLFILLIGLISKFFIVKPILHTLERAITKFPLVSPVYSGIKQIVHAFTDQDKFSFNTVVLAEFPTKGSYCIGFFTGECPKGMSPEPSTEYYNIYIPTTPNPTTGFFILMPREKFIISNLTRQEAMTIIISGGIIKPERFTETH